MHSVVFCCSLLFAVNIGMCSSWAPSTQLLFMWGYLILHYCLIMCLCKNTLTTATVWPKCKASNSLKTSYQMPYFSSCNDRPLCAPALHTLKAMQNSVTRTVCLFRVSFFSSYFDKNEFHHLKGLFSVNISHKTMSCFYESNKKDTSLPNMPSPTYI